MTTPSLKKNFLFNVIGMGLPIFVSLATVPIFLRSMGDERYGVMSIVWILLGYFGFLDFGLSRASANALARLSTATAEERGRVLMSSFYLNGVMGAMGALVIFFAGSILLRDYLSLSPAVWAELKPAMPWVAAMLPMVLISGVALGALEARERFLTANITQTLGTTTAQIVPALCALYVSPTLDMVLPVAFGMRFLSLMATLLVLSRHESMRFYRYDRDRGQSLFQYGAWISVSNIVGPLLVSLDQLLISAKLGPALLVFYSVPMNLSVRLQVLAAALARSVFPRFSRYSQADAIDLAERTTSALAYLFGSVCVGTMFILEPFFVLWMGRKFADNATLVGQILILGVWVNGLALIAVTLVQGQGRPDLSAKLHLAELVPFIIVLWLMITHFGLVGAAIAWVLRVSVDAAGLFILGQFRLRRLLRVLPAVAIMGLGYGAARILFTHPPLWQLAAGIAAGVLTLLTGLLFDPSLRQAAGSALLRLRRI